MNFMEKRRTFLKVVGGVSGIGVLAGCSADEDDSEDEESDDENGGEDNSGEEPNEQDSEEDDGTEEELEEEAVFEFTEIVPGDRTVERGPSLELGATVENTGNKEETKKVTFEFEDGFSNEVDITLEPSEESGVTQPIGTEDSDLGNFKYTFSTEDDEISAILTVEESKIEEPATQSFSGSGQGVESGIDIEGGLTVIKAIHNGSSNFQVSLVDDSEFDDLFINHIGDFDGSQADLIDSGEYILDVNADGDWEIDIHQPRAASGDSLPKSMSGEGPDVVGPIDFSGTHVAEGSHSGSSNFQVSVYPMEGRFSELVFNEIGEFEGETTFSHSEVGWVDINADGEWELEFE